MKQVIQLFCICAFLFASNLSNAEEPAHLYDQESLLVAKGEPSLQWRFEDQGEIFIHYYYQADDTSYLIDTETGKLCNHYFGKRAGSCFPCEKDEVSQQCP